MKYTHIWLMLLLTILTRSSVAQNSEKLFKSAEPSIAFIGNAEGYGTGVVISNDGSILTNFHVVCTALPLSVKVKVKTSAGPVEKEFKNVEIQKVHKNYDLAIIKLKKNGESLYPFGVNKVAKVNPGSQCFVIGNPIVGEKHLRNTITSGLISSSTREFEDKSYIQISAAVNPGNSGGPLFDSKGQYIGVVTFKVIQSEGIGFAIPLSKISSKDFVLLKDKKGNKEKGKEYEDKAGEFFKNSKLANDKKTKALFLNMANYFYKMSMFEMPNESAPYNNIALMYYNLGEVEKAEVYYKKCVSIKASPEACQMLGIIYEKNKKIDMALKYWVKGAFSEGKTGPCAENAALAFLKKKKYLESAYLSKKAIIEESNYRYNQKRQTYNTASLYVASTILTRIAQKKKQSDFSLKEMNKLSVSNSKEVVNLEKIKQANKAKEAEELDLFNSINNLDIDTGSLKQEPKKSEKEGKSDDENSINIFNEVINGK